MSYKPEIIILVETNFVSNIGDNELGLIDYTIFRRDRYQTNINLKGGGILIAIKNCFLPKLIYKNYNFDCEQLFIKISIGKRSIILGAVYLPPRSSSEIYQHHINTVEDICSLDRDSDLILLGDFNLPMTSWVNNSDVDEPLQANCTHLDNLINDNVMICLNSFSFLNLSQRFPVNLNKGYTLDLCFSSLEKSEILNYDLNEYLILPERHHDIGVFKIDLNEYNVIEPISTSKNYYKADFQEIEKELNKIDWEIVWSGNNIEVNTEKFYSKLNSIIDSHVPTVSNSSKTTYPPWFSFELIKNIIRKKKLHKIWISSDLQEDYIEFKKLRAICLRQSRIDQRKYLEKIEKRTSQNTKEFWKYINRLSRCNGIPEFVNFKGYTSASIVDSCNLFAVYFKSTYSKLDMGEIDCNLNDIFSCDNLNSEFVISDSDLELALNKLGDGVSPGTDNLPEIFLKKCGNCLKGPLLFLFNSSISNGTFPDIWKRSYITPIFKAGDKTEVENYRPISILGTIAKVFDLIMSIKLKDKLISLIIIEQHGFMKEKSTLTNLLIFSDYVSNALNSGYQVDTIYLDFKKAFDSVDHTILIGKLYNMGISGSVLRWFFNYLTNRTMVVRIKGNLSEPFKINSGVPQGSHLGPLLFLLFINDINQNLKFSKILLFADDIKLYSIIKSPLDQSNLQIDLDIIYKWTIENKLKLNISKCSLLSIYRGCSFDTNYLINNNFLEKVTKQKDLGIIFQNNFEFNFQLQNAINTAMKSLGFLIRSTSKFKKDSIIYLYKTLVRPMVLYNSQIWSPQHGYGVRILESVQHKFFRYLGFKVGKPMAFYDHDYTELAKSVDLCSIKSLHEYYDLLLIKKILSKSQDSSFSNDPLSNLFRARVLNYNFRSKRQLIEIDTNKDYIFYSVIFRLRRAWNCLPSEIKSLENFKEYKNEIFNFVINY